MIYCFWCMQKKYLLCGRVLERLLHVSCSHALAVRGRSGMRRETTLLSVFTFLNQPYSAVAVRRREVLLQEVLRRERCAFFFPLEDPSSTNVGAGFVVVSAVVSRLNRRRCKEMHARVLLVRMLLSFLVSKNRSIDVLLYLLNYILLLRFLSVN